MISSLNPTFTTQPTLYLEVSSFHYLISPAPDFSFLLSSSTRAATSSGRIKPSTTWLRWFWKSLSCCFNRLLSSCGGGKMERGKNYQNKIKNTPKYTHTAHVTYHVTVPVNSLYQFFKNPLHYGRQYLNLLINPKSQKTQTVITMCPDVMQKSTYEHYLRLSSCQRVNNLNLNKPPYVT